MSSFYRPVRPGAGQDILAALLVAVVGGGLAVGGSSLLAPVFFADPLAASELLIRPLPRLESREMVTDAMLMAGEAAARFAVENRIPFPFTTQVPPDTQAEAEDMAAMFAFRKHFKHEVNPFITQAVDGATIIEG